MSKPAAHTQRDVAAATPPASRIFSTLLPVTLAVSVDFLTIVMQWPVFPPHLHDTLGVGTPVVGALASARGIGSVYLGSAFAVALTFVVALTLVATAPSRVPSHA